MKRKEAIVLREERVARFHPSVRSSVCSSVLFRLMILPLACAAFNGSRIQGNGEGTVSGRQEEERTCKITRRSRGARELARARGEARSQYAPPPPAPAVARPQTREMRTSCPRLLAISREVNARLGISPFARSLRDLLNYDTRLQYIRRRKGGHRPRRKYYDA